MVAKDCATPSLRRSVSTSHDHQLWHLHSRPPHRELKEVYILRIQRYTTLVSMLPVSMQTWEGEDLESCPLALKSTTAAIPFGTELEAAQHWPKDRSILCHFAFRYGKIMSLFTVVIAMHGWGSRTHLSQQLPFLNYLNRVCRIVFLLLSRRRCRSFSLATL
jgi:hypothetical protein